MKPNWRTLAIFLSLWIVTLSLGLLVLLLDRLSLGGEWLGQGMFIATMAPLYGLQYFLGAGWLLENNGVCDFFCTPSIAGWVFIAVEFSVLFGIVAFLLDKLIRRKARASQG